MSSLIPERALTSLELADFLDDSLAVFGKQSDRFANVPRAVLAHSTHVKGIGSYADGIEHPRVNVVLATGIPKDVCEQINLGYRDHQSVDLSMFAGREDDGILVVPNAGETLFRLSDGSVPG
ncbi:hypothetical protein ACFLSZ_03320 [Candidatus Bipolaricaulota bacterium]